MPESTPAPAAVPAEHERFGPSKVYILNAIVGSWFFWIIVALLLMALFVPMFIEGVSFQPPEDGDQTMKAIWAARIVMCFLSGMLTIFLIGNAVVDYLCIDYTYATIPRPLFYVTTGIISKDTDTIDPTTIIDCDIRRSPIDMMFGTGDLFIKTIDGRFVTITAVPNILAIRDKLLANPPTLRMFNQNTPGWGVPPQT